MPLNIWDPNFESQIKLVTIAQWLNCSLFCREQPRPLSAQGTWIESPDLSALHLPGFDPCPVVLAQIVNKERRRPLQCSLYWHCTVLYCVQLLSACCTALHCTAQAGRPAPAVSQSGSGSHLEKTRHPSKNGKVTSNTPQTFDFGSICTWNISFQGARADVSKMFSGGWRLSK